jgi:small subunit ribosomal protein S17
MNNRRRLTGVVTSNKMTKTVVVEVGRTFRHPLYGKVVHAGKHVKAHDELGCQIGDQVQIVESRPISRDKRWMVAEIVKHEIRTADAGVAEMAEMIEEPAPASETTSEPNSEPVNEPASEPATEMASEPASEPAGEAASEEAGQAADEAGAEVQP